MTKLSNERLNELNEMKVEKGLNSILSLLNNEELSAYALNIEEAKERVFNNMMKYEGNESMIEMYQEQLDGLNELEVELEERIANETTEAPVQEVAVKETSKIKLSKTQQKVMDDIKNATYSYRTKDGELLYFVYIDGKPVEANGAFITEEGNYKVKLNTRTLESMVKVGLIEVLDLVGDGYDTVKVNEVFEKPYKYNELTVIELRKIVNPKTGGYFTRVIACPVGQEEQALEGSGALKEGFTVFSQEVKEVTVH